MCRAKDQERWAVISQAEMDRVANLLGNSVDKVIVFFVLYSFLLIFSLEP
jgi:hypothetical protein